MTTAGYTPKVIGFAVLWKFLERTSVTLIALIVSILLARLLPPEDFGAVALLQIFVSLAQVFVIGGFNTALIQKKNADGLDFSTVFLFSMGMVALLYGILWFCAPPIAACFSMPVLVMPLRVLALILIPNAIMALQVAYATKQLDFRNIFIANLYSALLSGMAGVGFALYGFGLWAIVYYHLLHSILTMVFLFFRVKWRPEFSFCVQRLKSLFSFGSKIFLSSLVVTLFLDIRGILIGKVGNPSELAYFDRGKLFPGTFMSVFGQVLQSVALPVFSEKQDDPENLVEQVRKTTRLCMILTVPVLVLFIAVAPDLISFLLTDKWLPAVFYLNIFALTYLFHPPNYIAMEGLKAKGLSSQCFYIELIRKSMEFTTLIIAIPFGVKMIAYTVLLNGIFQWLVQIPFNHIYLNYKLKWQFQDQLPALLTGGAVWAALYTFQTLLPPFPAKWVTAIVIGCILYGAILLLCRNCTALWIMGQIKLKLQKIKGAETI